MLSHNGGSPIYILACHTVRLHLAHQPQLTADATVADTHVHGSWHHRPYHNKWQVSCCASDAIRRVMLLITSSHVAQYVSILHTNPSLQSTARTPTVALWQVGHSGVFTSSVSLETHTTTLERVLWRLPSSWADSSGSSSPGIALMQTTLVVKLLCSCRSRRWWNLLTRFCTEFKATLSIYVRCDNYTKNFWSVIYAWTSMVWHKHIHCCIVNYKCIPDLIYYQVYYCYY